MKKDVDDTKLIIPPYVSTLWRNVNALYVKDGMLIVDMKDGQKIHIPGLNQEEIEEIFRYHAASMEKESHEPKPKRERLFDFGSGKEGPFQFAFDAGNGISSSMKHNPEQSDLPPLPPEILDKVAQIAKLFNAGDMQLFDTPVHECNCVYCQVARAVQGPTMTPSGGGPAHEEDVEEVDDEDLKFEEWIVTEVGDKLFEVTNKFNTNEKYRVFLGEPIGCTCGEPNCTHIISVLKS
ncbi:MAG: hypothetical protein KDK48_03900 [Chlamydiia bacterium]|nr:hypothetical protein [Chlamydiia bacterium]